MGKRTQAFVTKQNGLSRFCLPRDAGSGSQPGSPWIRETKRIKGQKATKALVGNLCCVGQRPKEQTSKSDQRCLPIKAKNITIFLEAQKMCGRDSWKLFRHRFFATQHRNIVAPFSTFFSNINYSSIKLRFIMTRGWVVPPLVYLHPQRFNPLNSFTSGRMLVCIFLIGKRIAKWLFSFVQRMCIFFRWRHISDTACVSKRSMDHLFFCHQMTGKEK